MEEQGIFVLPTCSAGFWYLMVEMIIQFSFRRSEKVFNEFICIGYLFIINLNLFFSFIFPNLRFNIDQKIGFILRWVNSHILDIYIHNFFVKIHAIRQCIYLGISKQMIENVWEGTPNFFQIVMLQATQRFLLLRGIFEW